MNSLSTIIYCFTFWLVFLGKRHWCRVFVDFGGCGLLTNCSLFVSRALYLILLQKNGWICACVAILLLCDDLTQSIVYHLAFFCIFLLIYATHTHVYIYVCVYACVCGLFLHSHAHLNFQIHIYIIWQRWCA